MKLFYASSLLLLCLVIQETHGAGFLAGFKTFFKKGTTTNPSPPPRAPPPNSKNVSPAPLNNKKATTLKGSKWDMSSRKRPKPRVQGMLREGVNKAAWNALNRVSGDISPESIMFSLLIFWIRSMKFNRAMLQPRMLGAMETVIDVAIVKAPG
ncbi:hypothetical protein BJ684DRAFT_16670 [Piptocephalis cylindrospora]|uniref:Uncharacterized protein n=1 Tax=Piptocephalis cylindrospora TaxID=1907219 RepID=A0A4P9Y2R7_9FUNG|nr:hypothetical protein BJ684DRAFT_16670 [Piptocephalis cylindrospora]|eukprot:RKP12892.1 hypothetical protein BJ684DRAFT_16670 [Piptocephalis cylindrospora]